MCLTEQSFLTKNTKVKVTTNLLCNVITHAKHNIEPPTKSLCYAQYTIINLVNLMYLQP